MKKELTNLNVKVPKGLKDLAEKCAKRGPYVNLSEFTRVAIREKLERDMRK